MRKLSGGYTIVEVLMFLAVSGGLLISVTALVSGQQEKTEFTTGIRDFESRIQDALNDVGTGFYPSTGGFNCVLNAGGRPTVGTSGPASAQGANKDCIFAGKAIHFSPAAAGGDVNPKGKFDIHTIVGRRQVGTGGSAKEVNNIQEANPTILAGNVIPADSATLPSGLEFKRVYIGTNETSYGIAFISSFGQTDTGNGGVVSGSAGTSLMKLGLLTGESFDALQTNVGALSTPLSVVSDTVTICIGDPGNDGRLGAVLINGRGTEILFDADVPAGCSV